MRGDAAGPTVERTEAGVVIAGFPRSKRTVRIQLAEFEAVMAEALGVDKPSNRAVADYLDCGEATVSRIRNGLQNPGPGLIACLVTTLGPEGLARVCDFESETAA